MSNGRCQYVSLINSCAFESEIHTKLDNAFTTQFLELVFRMGFRIADSTDCE